MSISADNHYQFLGLPNGAPPWQVEVALERLSEQAASAVYESPQRSHELWDRIRKIREDLLSGDQQHKAYDRQLRAQGADESTKIGPASLGTAFRESNPTARTLQKRSLPRSLVAAFFVALLIPVAAALLSRSSNGHKKASTPVLALSNAGKVTRGGFVSGEVASLQWTKVSHADSYHLEIATVAGDPSDAVVFQHPARILTTTSAHYSLLVVGKQVYYWRVQAHMGHAWLPYTRSQHFLVNQPTAGIPTLLLPKNGAVLFNKRLTLCWSSVSGTVDYLLTVEGMKTKTVKASCSSIPVHLGQYGWKVAAQVHGVRTYTGSYSPMSVFKILLRAKPNKRHPVIALRKTKPAVRTVAINLRGRTGSSVTSSRTASASSNRRAVTTIRGSHAAPRAQRKSGVRPPRVSHPKAPKKSPGTVQPPKPPVPPVISPPSPVAAKPTGVVYVVVVPTPAHQTITKVSPARSSAPAPVTYVQNPAARRTVVVASGRPGITGSHPGSAPPPSTQPTPVRKQKHDHCKRANCSIEGHDQDGD